MIVTLGMFLQEVDFPDVKLHGARDLLRFIIEVQYIFNVHVLV